MKDKIIETSILLFEKRGFSSTSIQHITNALDVTKGTFYYYFTSKEQLLMEIHEEYITDLLDRQQQAIKNATTNREKLAAIVHLLITDIETKGSAGRVFFREIRHLDAENAHDIRSKRDLFRANITTILQNGIASGEFRSSINPNILSFAILGVTNWSYQWYYPGGDISPAELTDMFLDMILNGIATIEEVES
jgi:TetR/AcrR family transcriptional regulator, cholesterol catabolism regulator